MQLVMINIYESAVLLSLYKYVHRYDNGDLKEDRQPVDLLNLLTGARGFVPVQPCLHVGSIPVGETTSSEEQPGSTARVVW